MSPRPVGLALLMGLVVVASNSLGQVPPTTDTGKLPSHTYSPDPQIVAEFKLTEELYPALAGWIETGSAQQGEMCDQIAEKLITSGTPSVEAWFLAAKVAETRGQIDKAVELLKEIADNHGHEKTPGFQSPADVSANMWLGRLARESGKHELAIQAFARAARRLDALPRVRFLSTLCTMYIGEVQADCLSNAAEAKTAYADAASALIIEPTSRDTSPDEFLGMWAQWKLAEINPEVKHETCPDRLQSALSMLLFQQLALNGIVASPRIDFYSGAGDSRSYWYELCLERALETTKGQIDRDAIYLTLAEFELENKAYDRVLTALDGIGQDSFFAAIATQEKERIRGLMVEKAE